MNLRNEALLADDLRELAATPTSGPDVDAIIRRGRHLSRRRIAAASAAASVVVAGAVAAAVVVSTSQPGVAAHPTVAAAGSRPVNVQPTVVHPVSSQAGLSAQLTAAFTKAVATSEVTVVATMAGGKTETVTVPGQRWQETVVWSASGVKQSLSFSSAFAGSGKHAGDTGLKTLYLDYANRTFSITTSYLAKGVHALLFPVPQPESLKTSSWSKLTGSATIDGQPAWVLDQSGSGGLTATTWLSKHSLLPLKSVEHTAVGLQTYQYAWASAVGATAAVNTPAIPSGFARSDSAAGVPAIPASR
jgi:hypothetical protein